MQSRPSDACACKGHGYQYEGIIAGIAFSGNRQELKLDDTFPFRGSWSVEIQLAYPAWLYFTPPKFSQVKDLVANSRQLKNAGHSPDCLLRSLLHRTPRP